MRIFLIALKRVSSVVFREKCLNNSEAGASCRKPINKPFAPYRRALCAAASCSARTVHCSGERKKTGNVEHTAGAFSQLKRNTILSILPIVRGCEMFCCLKNCLNGVLPAQSVHITKTANPVQLDSSHMGRWRG